MKLMVLNMDKQFKLPSLRIFKAEADHLAQEFVILTFKTDLSFQVLIFLSAQLLIFLLGLKRHLLVLSVFHRLLVLQFRPTLSPMGLETYPFISIAPVKIIMNVLPFS